MRTLFLALLALGACNGPSPSDTGDTGDTDDHGTGDDLDGDGYATSVDCDDGDDTIHPGATETCDGVDQDCDGTADDDAVDAGTWHADADDDGYGATEPITACDQPEGTVTDGTDCDDTEAGVHPGATETCDGVDQDCDGTADDGATDASTFYRDADGDGWGTSTTTTACTRPAGFATRDGDCDDAASTVHPEADERCNGVDDDCDDAIDEDATDATTWYVDADEDGFGDSKRSFVACDGGGAAPVADDCDDTDADVNPAATEHCDEVDEDCDGKVDDGAVDAFTFHADKDGDTYGDPTGATLVACVASRGFVLDDTDCDDARASVYPDADELCNTIDDDCDGTIDEDDAIDAPTWYVDADADRYGDPDAATKRACSEPAGYCDNGDDCNDSNAGFNPGAAEIQGNLFDENCDGISGWDLDGDGHHKDGVCVSVDPDTLACLVEGDDCDDGDATVYPGATELDDLIDNDCDTVCDEGIIGAGDLVITELMIAPLTTESYSEYAELVNVSGVDLPICGGWRLVSVAGKYSTVGFSTSTKSPFPAPNLVLAPGDALVVGRSFSTSRSATDYNGGVPVDVYAVTGGFDNSKDTITLELDGTVIDTVSYDKSASGWSSIVASGKALELKAAKLDATSNDSATNWCQAKTSYGDGGYGTPGAGPSCP